VREKVREKERGGEREKNTYSQVIHVLLFNIIMIELTNLQYLFTLVLQLHEVFPENIVHISNTQLDPLKTFL